MTHTTRKAIKDAYKQYKNSRYYYLSDCYTNASPTKHNAMHYCRNLAHNNNAFLCGEPLKIIGFNSQTFSVGFVGIINEKPAFFWITKENNRYIYLDEITE